MLPQLHKIITVHSNEKSNEKETKWKKILKCILTSRAPQQPLTEYIHYCHGSLRSHSRWEKGMSIIGAKISSPIGCTRSVNWSTKIVVCYEAHWLLLQHSFYMMPKYAQNNERWYFAYTIIIFRILFFRW